jgi:hypothetical protein
MMRKSVKKMAEEPTKLFATRSERYPQPNEADGTRTALEKLAERVPILGPLTVHIIAQFLVPGVDRRREEWFKELADDIDRLQEKVDGFRVEDLANSEAFVSATIKATRIAIGTHQTEKRKYLRNALLNVAKGTTADELKQQIFLNAIEEFSPAHVKALNLIWRGPALIRWDEHSIPMPQRNYGAAMEIVVPQLKGQPGLIGAVLTDLRNRGFSNLSRSESSFPQGGIITNLGVEFLNFVLSPEDLPQ